MIGQLIHTKWLAKGFIEGSLNLGSGLHIDDGYQVVGSWISCAPCPELSRVLIVEVASNDAHNRRATVSESHVHVSHSLNS